MITNKPLKGNQIVIFYRMLTGSFEEECPENVIKIVEIPAEEFELVSKDRNIVNSFFYSYDLKQSALEKLFDVKAGETAYMTYKLTDRKTVQQTLNKLRGRIKKLQHALNKNHIETFWFN